MTYISDILLEQIKNTAFDAVQKAGMDTLKYFRQSGLSTDDKRKNNDFDPVTIADKNAELIIRDIIEKNFPDHNIIGEEYGTHHQNSDFTWVIDPIDGTRAFITGIPLWGVLVGVTYLNKPLFGVMFQPYNNELFYGDNNSAFLRRGDDIICLRASDITDIQKSYSLCTSPDIYIHDTEKAQFQTLKSQTRHTRFGTDCYGYMMVCMGNAHIVFETGLSPYDIVPLLPIITGSGAVYSNLMGTDDISNGTILVSANAILHAQALKILNQIS